MGRAAGQHLVAQPVGEPAQGRHMHAAVGQFQVGNRCQRRLTPLQHSTHLALAQALLNGLQPLRTFGVAEAHVVLAAIAVGKVSGLAHLGTRISENSGNVLPWTLNTHSKYYSVSLTR